MQAITYNQAIQNLADLIDDVSDNHEPLIITHENHKAVVLMSLDDFNAWQETEYLTRSPANARDLLDAVEDITQRKNLIKHALIEE
jgi:antitoxin YefM